ncbi:hypothetical protein V502_11321 [Pseudogymnoascus sp. VKM F-4520 (FW-2644)]|nr:hypothetical protein V502_11321 [Pseudogymnoascus sp. VKM F-4520 (FW-2644)]
MLGENGDEQFVQTNIAVWILTSAATAFLAVRLYCRLRFSQVWWDDFVLTSSWLMLLIAGALLSSATTVGYDTDDDKRAFFRLHHTSTSMTTIATSWSKVAFAITMTRIVHNHILTCCLWGIIVTANLVIILGIVSIWIPACGDPLAIYRPEHNLCWPLRDLQYIGGTTIVYGGVIDILLALCPWFVIRSLLLQTREKIGLTIAMSLGALTGAIVILRAFFQFINIANTYHFMVFMSIFNFMEPAVSIIAQTIPMFRVLFIRAKRDTQGDIRINSLASRGELTGVKTNSLENARTWENKTPGHLDRDYELLNVRVSPGGRVIQVPDPYEIEDNRSYVQ